MVGTTATQTLTNKTLTSPKADFITDTSGGKEIELVTTPSSANWVRLTNTTVGNGVTIGANGTGANEDLVLAPLGTGQVKVGTSQVTTAANTQTLSNKTLTAPIVNGTSGNLTISASTDGGEYNLNASVSGKLAVYGAGAATLDLNLLDGQLYTNSVSRMTNAGLLQNTDLTGTGNTFPTLNQNTTGSAATLTTPRTVQTNLASTASTSFNGSANITPGITGTLPVLNGGTGVTTSTGTGSTVLSASPTLTGTPNIATATGTSLSVSGQLTSTVAVGTAPLAITSTTKVTNLNADTVDGIHANATATANQLMPLDSNAKVNSSLLYNPYKFSVYRSAAYTSTVATSTRMPYDTKDFDTGSNVDIVTNTGRFTAPVSGFYQFNAVITLSANQPRFFIEFYKNGSGWIRGTDAAPGTGGTLGSIASAHIQLVAGDYIEVFYYCSAAQALDVTTRHTSFSGFLVSIT
jgi:hypothetical protein